MGAFEAAEPYVAKALEAERLNPAARVTRARLLLAKGQAADALDVLSAPDLDTPPRFEALLLRGEALAQTDCLADAVAVYERAVALRPDAPGAYYALSVAQLAAGKPAAAAFTRCVTLRPDADWFRERQVDALRLGVDTYVVSDAVNFIRMRGWQDDTASYVMLAAALTQLRTGKAAEAAASLAAIGHHVKAADWMAKLVAFVQGKLTDAALVAAAKGDGELTEAHAYAGIKASIDGERDKATTHLTWVKTSGVKSFVEYRYALGELKRLAGSGPQAVRSTSAVAALTLGLAVAGPAAAQDSRDWKQLATAGFTVVGDADPRDLQRAGDEIARFRDALRTMRSGVRVDPDAPLVVVVFRDDGVMRPYKPRDWSGTIAAFLTAWFGPSPDVNYLVTSSDGLGREGASEAFRAYASHVVGRNLRRAPLWLAQGLTDFYGSFTTRDRDGKTYVGAPVARHVGTFKQLSPLPLADLIAIDGFRGLPPRPRGSRAPLGDGVGGHALPHRGAWR